MNTTVKIAIDEIEATAATQVRVRIDPGVIDEYAEDMGNGAIFPPMIVFAEQGSERYILADGFHRLAAFKKSGITKAEVQVLEGGLREALKYALKANAQNGLRRTRADKNHAVDMALKDPEIGGLTLRDIAELCRVVPETVRLRKQRMNEPKADGVSIMDKKPADKTVRPTKPEPNQADVDLSQLMGICKDINSFPYTGYEAVERLPLERKHEKTIEQAADWMDSIATTLTTKLGEQDED